MFLWFRDTKRPLTGAGYRYDYDGAVNSKDRDRRFVQLGFNRSRRNLIRKGEHVAVHALTGRAAAG